MRIGFAPGEENAVIDELEAGLAEAADGEDEQEAPVRSYFNLRIGSLNFEIWRR